VNTNKFILTKYTQRPDNIGALFLIWKTLRVSIGFNQFDIDSKNP